MPRPRAPSRREAWVLFAILFLWQFPHFYSIAWMYKEDYARAGIRMLPVVEPDCRSTARQIVLYGIVLIPVSLIPRHAGNVGPHLSWRARCCWGSGFSIRAYAWRWNAPSVARARGAGDIGFLSAADLRPHALGQARSVIQVQNLTHRYGDRVALSNVSFEVKTGRNLRPARAERRRQIHPFPHSLHHDGAHRGPRDHRRPRRGARSGRGAPPASAWSFRRRVSIRPSPWKRTCARRAICTG